MWELRLSESTRLIRAGDSKAGERQAHSCQHKCRLTNSLQLVLGDGRRRLYEFAAVYGLGDRGSAYRVASAG
jgi:hypothetical protein